MQGCPNNPKGLFGSADHMNSIHYSRTLFYAELSLCPAKVKTNCKGMSKMMKFFLFSIKENNSCLISKMSTNQGQLS